MMKQVNFRQKKIVRPRESIEKTLVDLERLKRGDLTLRLRIGQRGKKRMKHHRSR